MYPRALGSGTTLFLLLVFFSPPSLAATLPGTPMLLEIWVNGRTRHLVVPVVERNGLLFMKTDDIAASDIKLGSNETPPCGYIAVNRISGVQAEIARGEQKLLLTVAMDRLAPQAFDLRADPNADLAVSDTGFIGSYNLVGTVDDFSRTSQPALIITAARDKTARWDRYPSKAKTNRRDFSRRSVKRSVLMPISRPREAYATQYPNGAVALVRTGQPNTRIYQENRQVATTDEDGETLITNFTPFTANRIAIDPRDYDLSSSIDASQKIVVPRRQSGVIVDMTPAQHQPVIIVLHQESGAFPPMGARVSLSKEEPPIVVGRHGEVFIADLQKTVKGLVEFDSGSCHFEVAPPQRSKDNPIPRLDPVQCLTGQAS